MKLFGVPIIAAVIAGILFPYTALSLMPFGFVFLFILMFLSGMSIDWQKLPAASRRPLEIFVGIFLIFVFFPLLQLLLAKMFITDSQLLAGIVFGALMPVALVAPFFTKQLGGDEEMAFLLMVISMLLAPILSPVLLKLMTPSNLPIQTAPLMKIMLLLVTVPLLASFLISRYMPKFRQAINPYLGIGNMTCLSVLIFILFGTAAGRVNLDYESRIEIGKLLALAFFQDFGVLFLVRFFAAKIFAPRDAKALMVSLSMKNAAIAAGILLFYDPRASLAPALVFIAHACLFSFLPWFKQYLAIAPKNDSQTIC